MAKTGGAYRIYETMGQKKDKKRKAVGLYTGQEKQGRNVSAGGNAGGFLYGRQYKAVCLYRNTGMVGIHISGVLFCAGKGRIPGSKPGERHEGELSGDFLLACESTGLVI